MCASHRIKAYFRTPVSDTFWRSPLNGIVAHGKKVQECIDVLSQAVRSYVDGQFDEVMELTKRASALEGEADLLKGNIRNHMPKFIFLSVDKRDFLLLLSEQDKILDYSEDVALLLQMRNTTLPDSLREDFLAHAEKVRQTVIALGRVLELFQKLWDASFARILREDTKDNIKKVHRLEWEADQLEARLSRKLFNMDEMSPLAAVHLLKVVDRMDQIANHAENAADRVRAMIAK